MADMRPPFIQFPIDLTRLVGVMGDIHDQLVGIHEALDRLAPPIAELAPSQPAGLSDLRHTDPSSIAKVKRELELFAQNSDTVVDSDAFVQAIIEYERQIVDAYGEEAISELPWNKALGSGSSRGSLFSEARKARDAEERSAKERAQDHRAEGSQAATESKATSGTGAADKQGK